MSPLHACASCGRGFTPRHARQTHCPEHELRGREHRSPTTRAQDAEYRRMRGAVLADQPTCWVAGCTAQSDTVDHVVPVASGGTHERANLRGCCSHHNLSRGSRPLAALRGDVRASEPEEAREPNRAVQGLRIG